MSLGVSHGCWSGSCSSFHMWRVAVARAAGLPPLAMMEGYFRNYSPPVTWSRSEDVFEYSAWFVAIGAEKIPAQSSMSLSPAMREAIRDLPISWKPFESDPLVILLTHPDDGGKIAHKDCAPIAKRLHEVAKAMVAPEHEDGRRTDQFWWLPSSFSDSSRAKQFAKGLMKAQHEEARRITDQFAKGLMTAHELGEDVTFR